MKKEIKFWIKAYKATPMLDNPEVSCGFEVEEMWIAKFIGENSALGWNSERGELRVFKRSDIIRWEE